LSPKLGTNKKFPENDFPMYEAIENTERKEWRCRRLGRDKKQFDIVSVLLNVRKGILEERAVLFEILKFFSTRSVEPIKEPPDKKY